jgi:hypothetical protein
VVGGGGYVCIEDSKTGGYPQRATDTDETRPTGVITAAQMVASLPSPAIAFKAYHADCDPHPELTSYWFGVERAETLRDWCRWVAQLSTKVWMCKYDLKRMLQFWFENRGGSLWDEA